MADTTPLGLKGLECAKLLLTHAKVAYYLLFFFLVCFAFSAMWRVVGPSPSFLLVRAGQQE